MDVSKVQARKMVLVSIFALFAISVYRNRSAETPAATFRRFWATGVVAEILSLLADFAPGVAGPFAVLTVLGWVVKDGTDLIGSALGISTAAAAPVSSGQAPHTTSSTNPTGGTTTVTGP